MKSKTKSIEDYEEFKKATRKSLLEREGRETWLNAMEHGKIGEIQTKVELLKKGLWVSERVVDVNGADLIVQKASLLNDLIDLIGAPVAFVQIKNVGAETDVSIDSRYIYYVDGEDVKIKKEFFLFIYRNDDPDFLVFLSAEGIDEVVNNGGCSKYVKNNSGATYIKFTSNQLKNLNVKSTALGESIDEIHAVLSESEYNRTIGLRHFLGVKPSKEGTEEILNKRYLNNYTADLGEEFYNTKLYLHKLMELYAVWPFVIKDILVAHSNNPQEVVEEIPYLKEKVEAYQKQIQQKWNKYKYKVPSTIEDYSKVIEPLQKAIDNTLDMHNEQYKLATEGVEDEEDA